MCISQGYIQNFKRNWKNPLCIRIEDFTKIFQQISKFHGSLKKEKETEVYKSLSTTPYVGNLTEG